MNPRIQVIAVLGSIAVVLVVFELIRRRKLREEYAFIWFAAGIGLIVVSTWRESLELLAAWTGVAYPPSVLLLAAIVLGLLLALHFSVSLSRLADQNKRLAQEVALLRHALDRATDPARRRDEPDRGDGDEATESLAASLSAAPVGHDH